MEKKLETGQMMDEDLLVERGWTHWDTNVADKDKEIRIFIIVSSIESGFAPFFKVWGEQIARESLVRVYSVDSKVEFRFALRGMKFI